MMTILVTGSNGQLGSELRDLAPGFPDARFIFTDVAELDITDPDQVTRFFDRERPDVVINCAAYTAVDKAEDDEPAARRLNAMAPGILATACARNNGFFVQTSTDYIFDGEADTPVTEEKAPAPRSVYGRTKLDGEREVLNKAVHGVIVRTAWLYSSYGNNFVKSILKKARETGSLRVVNDQTGSPTYARDLALAVLDIIRQRQMISGVEIFHYADEGSITWYDFALTIVRIKEVACTVVPVRTEDYPARAIRPRFSVLSTEKIRARFGITIPHWEVSLHECLTKID